MRPQQNELVTQNSKELEDRRIRHAKGGKVRMRTLCGRLWSVHAWVAAGSGSELACVAASTGSVPFACVAASTGSVPLACVATSSGSALACVAASTGPVPLACVAANTGSVPLACVAASTGSVPLACVADSAAQRCGESGIRRGTSAIPDV